jgi:hypothetical protein
VNTGPSDEQEAKHTFLLEFASGLEGAGAGFHAVVPKKDCEHMKLARASFDEKSPKDDAFSASGRTCEACEGAAGWFGNWMCLACYKVKTK